jgi:hypothetical protein
MSFLATSRRLVLIVFVPLACGGRFDLQTDRPEPTGEAGAAAEQTPELACKACRGDWGAHGLSPVPGCNCRTADSGRACRDSSQCEGQCLADTPAAVVTSPGPPRLGYPVGACSEFQTSFGCHAVLSNGIALGEPLNLEEPITQRCWD